MRVDPSLAWALIIFAGYVTLIAILWTVNRVHYPTIGDSRQNVVRGIIVPIGAGGVALAIATTGLGWWEAVLFDEVGGAPAWTWSIPILLAVISLIRFTTIDWRSPKASVVPSLVVGGLIVGFSEELLARGVVIVGLRADFAELWVWLGSCALFGVLHAINGRFGQRASDTVTQVVITFILGSAFYVTRMVTGTLIVGMILHAAWDVGTLGTKATDGEESKFATLLTLVLAVAGLVAGLMVAI